MQNRIGSCKRKTKETDIELTINLDGQGKNQIDTGIPFFDHMLDGFARHGLFDLNVKVRGDLEVDSHHTIEDTGIVLGQAIAQALGDKAGIKRYSYAMGSGFSEADEHEKAKAMALAEESDVIVAVVGGSSSRFGGAVFDANGAASKGTGSRSMDCGEGMDTAKVHIPAAQEELIAALARLGKPLVTVVIAGRAYCIEKIENASDAVLYAFYPGPMGGRAVAELLYGSSNPSGRLPVSMPRHVGQIPVCYNYRTSVAPAYCDMTSQPLHTFGEGRSYTTFTGSDVSVTKEENGISVSFTVENTGNMAGTSVPCLYVRKRSGGVVARIKELKAFTRIALAPGEKKEAVFHLTKEELNFVQIPGKPEVICHEYELMLEDGAEKWWTGNVTEM